MLTRLVIQEKRLAEAGDGPAQVLAFVSPTDAEKHALGETLHLDEYDLASVFDPDEVARLEVSGQRLFVLWKAPARVDVSEAVHLGVQPVGIVLEREQLAFVMGADAFPLSAREFRSVESAIDVMLGFLLHSVRHYVGHLRVIKQLSASLERKITVSMENKHLLQMFALSESLVYYLDAIESNGSVLTKLRSAILQLGITAHQQQLFEDIVLENQQAARQANIYSSVLSGLMDARGTIVNNNMSVLLKNLTLINIVFLPLNLIASIGGMSEFTMMTRGLDWRLAYALFSLGMIGLGWITFIAVQGLIDRRGARRQEAPR